MENSQERSPLYYFEEICNIPHKSGDEKHIIKYLTDFAKKHNLEYRTDDQLNLLIKKKGSAGKENCAPLVLQSHVDMVYVKTPDSKHVYGQPLELIKEGDRLFAKDTSLGADNGIGVAITLAILCSEQITHPPIEAVFTVKEEDGLIGASFFPTDWLVGRRLINLDSEEENSLIVGCAGAFRSQILLAGERISPPDNLQKAMYIGIDGLTGGHSGIDINKNRGNANVLMGRLLGELNNRFDFLIAHIEGGIRMNSIPTSSRAIIYIDEQGHLALTEHLKHVTSQIIDEYTATDTNINISFGEYGEHKENILPFCEKSTLNIIDAISLHQNGVLQTDLTTKNLVITSSNLGQLTTKDNCVSLLSSVRSNINSQKDAAANKLKSLSRLLGAKIIFDSTYPAWEYAHSSPLRELYVSNYLAEYGKPPHTEVIHAGLECGILVDKYPTIDAISVGPNIYNVHSTNEYLSLTSLNRFYSFLIKFISSC